MSITKTRYGRLASDMKAAINEALRDPSRFHSNEMDIVPWLILLFVSALAGLTGALYSVSWHMVADNFKPGSDLIYTSTNNPEIPGMAAGAILSIWSVWYYFMIHKRCGQVIFPGYVAKVRGSRVVLLNIQDVKNVELSSFEYGSTEKGTRRTGTSMVAKLKDGSKFKILSDNGSWLSTVKAHIGVKPEEPVHNSESDNWTQD